MGTIQGGGVGEWLHEGMCGFLPVYGDDGSNGTIILFKEKQSRWDRRKLRTILAGLARVYQKDLRLIRAKGKELGGQKTMNPLPISPDIILVPFRTRKPVGKDDGAVGYIFRSAIKEIRFNEDATEVVLKDGQAIRILEGLATAKRHFHRACLIGQNSLQYGVDIRRKEDAWREIQEIYNQPATRGDIAILSKNIMNLMEKLGV